MAPSSRKSKRPKKGTSLAEVDHTLQPSLLLSLPNELLLKILELVVANLNISLKDVLAKKIHDKGFISNTNHIYFLSTTNQISGQVRAESHAQGRNNGILSTCQQLYALGTIALYSSYTVCAELRIPTVGYPYPYNRRQGPGTKLFVPFLAPQAVPLRSTRFTGSSTGIPNHITAHSTLIRHLFIIIQGDGRRDVRRGSGSNSVDAFDNRAGELNHLLLSGMNLTRLDCLLEVGNCLPEMAEDLKQLISHRLQKWKKRGIKHVELLVDYYDTYTAWDPQEPFFLEKVIFEKDGNTKVERITRRPPLQIVIE